MISEVVEHDRLLERAQEVADLVNRNAPLAVRGHAAGHPQGHRPAAARGRDPRRDLPRTRAAHRRRQGGAAGLHREARAEVERPMSAPGTASSRPSATRRRPTTSPPSRLNRPEVLNAFDRQMCEEIRDAWRLVKDDPAVHAVVLRAEGDRAFCAGLDTKKPYGQPDDVWNHEDPGELLSPKWQKVWKPVVCAVQGMCTRGRLLLPERSRRRHLLDRRHLLRLARHLRHGLRARAGRADAEDRVWPRPCASR